MVAQYILDDFFMVMWRMQSEISEKFWKMKFFVLIFKLHLVICFCNTTIGWLCVEDFIEKFICLRYKRWFMDNIIDM